MSRPILSVDLFAGGGGASEAIRQATGRALIEAQLDDRGELRGAA